MAARPRLRLAVVGDARDSRFDAALEEIHNRIVHLELAPGSVFTEGELAADLGMSKTPVREALQVLGFLGLVEAAPRRGYRVAPITIRHTRELFDLRELIEGEAAAEAARRPPDNGQLAELNRLAEARADPDDPASIGRFLDDNLSFHAGVAAASGNRRLERLVRQMLFEQERLFHLSLRLTNRTEEMVHEHHDLLAALIDGEPDRARSVAVEQVGAARRMVLDALLSSAAILEANVGELHEEDARGG
jgi:DNA-binding GntR family transcriptional regulator